MTTKPILFSAPMIRALLDDRKTQTRRVVKFNAAGRVQLGGRQWHINDKAATKACPYGQPGDLLWVRETHSIDCDPHWVLYKADNKALRIAAGEAFDGCEADDMNTNLRWRPSIHMPRWASRLTLRITDVRVERVQSLSEADAWHEGAPTVEGPDFPADQNASWECAQDWFADLWDDINAASGFGWEANPWTWALTFEVIRANVDTVLREDA